MLFRAKEKGYIRALGAPIHDMKEVDMIIGKVPIDYILLPRHLRFRGTSVPFYQPETEEEGASNSDNREWPLEFPPRLITMLAFCFFFYHKSKNK